MKRENLRTGWLTTLFAAVLSCGCGESATPVAAVPGDPWLNPPPLSDIVPEFIAASAHAPVAAEHIAEAEQFLATESISQISPGEVSYFAGHPITLPAVARPYLVRGVYRNNASFTVAIVGNALWVASTDPADASAPLRHQPLVLIMDEVPQTVYVTAGAAP